MKIITIDGPASSGKGTVAKLVAKELHFNYLESGAIYRALAWLVLQDESVKPDDTANILKLIHHWILEFINGKVMVNNIDITDELRHEKVGMMASTLAGVGAIRQALLNYQRSFAQRGDLVTDGRDMGSVVFPQAVLKVYLTADIHIRAKRRFNQLQLIGKTDTMEDVFADICLRDKQDTARCEAPLIYNDSYKLIDNTQLSINDTVVQIIKWFYEAIEGGNN